MSDEQLEEYLYSVRTSMVVSSKSRTPADMVRAIGVAPTRIVELDPSSICAIEHACWFTSDELSLSDPAEALHELVTRWRPLVQSLVQLDDCDKMLALWIGVYGDPDGAPPFELEIPRSAIQLANELGGTIRIGFTAV